MKELRLRKLHRWFGITMALFLILQAGTGLIMPLGVHPTLYKLFVFIHYGGGTGGLLYRVFLSLGTFCTAISGIMIFFALRARSKKRQ